MPAARSAVATAASASMPSAPTQSPARATPGMPSSSTAGRPCREKTAASDGHLGQEADHFGLFAPTGDGEVDELLEFPAVGGGIGSRRSDTCHVDECRTRGRQPGNRGVHGKIERLINAKGDPRRTSRQRAQPRSRHATRTGCIVGRRRPVMRSTAAGDTARTMPSAWIASKLSHRFAQPDLDTKLPGALLQTGNQCLPASVEIKHAADCGAPELFQSRTSAQPRQIGRIGADPHQHGHELANAWGAGAPLNPFLAWTRPRLPRRSTTCCRMRAACNFSAGAEQARGQQPASSENQRVHPAVCALKTTRNLCRAACREIGTPHCRSVCAATPCQVQSVRPEIQKVAAILPRDRAASQVLRLLQKHYLAALACQRIGGREAGQAASDDDISFIGSLLSGSAARTSEESVCDRRQNPMSSAGPRPTPRRPARTSARRGIVGLAWTARDPNLCLSVFS